MLREFTAGLKPRVLGQLVDVVFDKMKLAGEAGSLLKIEEEILDAIDEAKNQWQEGPKPEQQLLFQGMADPRPKQQELSFDVKGITDERFWEQAEDRILDALKDYAEWAGNGQTIRRRLFAEDAARGFAFIALCRKRYDVVLMNPPFGESSRSAYIYIKEHYTHWNKNLLCAFFLRTVDLAQDKGLIGSVYDRSAAIKTTYKEFRKDLFLSDGRFQTQADLGWEVLDANVEVSAGIISSTGILSSGAFFDVTRETPSEKGKFLQNGIDDLRHGKENSHVFFCKSIELLKLPNSVLAFQFPIFVRKLFSKEKAIGLTGCRSFKGHDFKSDRHLRLFWEITSLNEIGFDKKKYTRIFNGGEYSPYYHPSRDIALYGIKGSIINYHESVTFRNFDFQGIGGVGYGKRGIFLDAQIIPKEHAYTAEGIGCIVESEDDSFYYTSLFNSRVFQFIINLYCGQHKSSSYVNCFPNPPSSKEFYEEVVDSAKEIWQLKRLWQQGDETDTVFLCPWILHHGYQILSFGIDSSLKEEKKSDEIISNNTEIIETCFESIYRIPKSELFLVRNYSKQRPKERVWLEGPEDPQAKSYEHIKTLISYSIGCVFGRWDIRMGVDQTLSPRLSCALDRLPVCPPGMLVGIDGLPVESRRIVSEEWLRARPDTNSLPPDRVVKNSTIPDTDYPIRINWEGILVDDPEHEEDIVRRAREAVDLLWKDKAHEIEQEACDILGVSDLHDYFRRSSGFFQHHLKRYSKSRRKAPIYWPLSTKSGSYTLWIYYHCLTDQTLYACVNDYVNPKLNDTSKDIVRLKELVTKQGSKKNRQRLEQLMDFERELKDYRDEFFRVAGLPYKPNLNDGVMITAAPLWKLFRHYQWRKDLEACWKKLKEGEYDWAHLSYAIWPERVKEKCKTDFSIAIAHDLENLYEGDYTKPKKRNRKALV